MSGLQPSDSSVADALRGFQIRDYLEMGRRRIWWIILPAIAVFVATVVATFRLPDIYHSETVIQVDPQRVSDSVVQSPVTSSVGDRLTTIRILAVSPSRLKVIIQKLNLYPDLVSQHHMDRAISHMQKNINVEVADSGGQRLSAFKIGFSAKSPEQVAAVANELGAMVIRQNMGAREQVFSGTEDFLDSQLQETKRQLEDKETEVQRIKSQYVMDLPESKQFHLEALNSLRNQLRASQDRVNQDKQEKVYLQSMLNNGAPPTVDLDATNARSVSPYENTIQKEEAHLSELEARYGPQYPDVRKLQNEIADLKAKAAAEAKDQPAPEVEDSAKLAERARHNNPVVQAQVTKLDQEIEEETKRQSQMEPDIAVHLSKLEHEPIFQQQIAGLMRDYDMMSAHYNRLLDKRLSAQMAHELETRQQGERFEILDEAPVPQAPAGPNRVLFSFAGLIGGILGGLGLAMLIEMTDESVRSEREAAQILGKAVLGGVPLILSPGKRLRNYLKATFAIAGTAVVAALIGFVLPLVLKVSA